MNENDPELKNKIQAATFRRLVEHLQKIQIFKTLI